MENNTNLISQGTSVITTFSQESTKKADIISKSENPGKITEFFTGQNDVIKKGLACGLAGCVVCANTLIAWNTIKALLK